MGARLSDDGSDALPLNMQEEAELERGLSLLVLKEAETVVGDDCCVPVPAMPAASASATAGRAFETHWSSKGCERLTGPQKKEETKVASVSVPVAHAAPVD